MTADTKELVIEARIPIPTDLFAGSEIVSKVRDAYKSFEASLNDAMGDNVYTLSVSEKPPRKPRQSRSDAGQMDQAATRRGRRNGAAEQPVA